MSRLRLAAIFLFTWAEIRVVDAATGRGAPLADLGTVSGEVLGADAN